MLRCTRSVAASCRLPGSRSPGLSRPAADLVGDLPRNLQERWESGLPIEVDDELPLLLHPRHLVPAILAAALV